MTPTTAGVQQVIERRASRVRRVPSLFLAHGSPLSVMDKPFGTALRKFVSRQKRLRAIVVVSAHWQTQGGLRVTSNPQPQLAYDFMGFPSWAYQLSYPCPGDRSVAQAVAILLEREGIDARLDPDRGLDHGVWVPLSLAVPEAKTPVVQLSLPLPGDPDLLLRVGKALAPLRSEDILIVGTGGIVHNLQSLEMDTPAGIAEPWAEEFDGWVHDRAVAMDRASLADYRKLAPHANTAAPTPEHFDPLLVIMGTALPNDSVLDLYAGFRYGTLSMRSFALVGRRREDRGQ
ncbi:MAG: class III extradiol ring-cleavage dioxygenase [Vicinamibacterales bacterium]|nr:class III extradiol ring-cleavage dioxygenase [Vicinamibacterales bacterium]